MIRFNAILIRIIKELIRDKRTLALMMIAPIIVLILMNVVFNSANDPHLKLGIDNTVPSALFEELPTDQIEVISYKNNESIKHRMNKDDLDAFIHLNDSTFQITYENIDPGNTEKIKTIFQQLLTELKLKELTSALQKTAQKKGTDNTFQTFTIKSSYVYGSSTSTFFDKIFPILIGFFVFFFVFLISGIALLRERTSGTLERLLATPVKRTELVLGYLVGYGIFAIIQTLIIIFFSIYMLDLQIAGSLLWVILTTNLIALTALSMGIFVSTFANSEFQMIQFIPLIVIPQIFFSGLVSLDSMADWAQKLAYLFPLRYAGAALSNIILKGQGWSSIWPDLSVLLLFILGFTLLNIVGLKRYRKV